MLQEEKQIKEKREKQDNYAKYVRETYWPSVSVKKQMELEQNISNISYFQRIRNSIDQNNAENTHNSRSLSKSPPRNARPWRVNGTIPKHKSIENTSKE